MPKDTIPPPRFKQFSLASISLLRQYTSDVDDADCSESNEAEDEVDQPEERLLELLVASRHPTELLELNEEPFDPVSLALGRLVERHRVLGVLFR